MTTKLKEFRKLSPFERQKAFLKWIKRRPKNLQYNFMDSSNCPLAQFGHYLGLKKAYADAQGFSASNRFPICNTLTLDTDSEKYTHIVDFNRAIIIARFSSFGELAKAFSVDAT